MAGSNVQATPELERLRVVLIRLRAVLSPVVVSAVFVAFSREILGICGEDLARSLLSALSFPVSVVELPEQFETLLERLEFFDREIRDSLRAWGFTQVFPRAENGEDSV